jgi:flagellar protein FlbD
MIELTRLGSHGEPLWINPDLITTLEAHPDTVVAMTNNHKVMVRESVDEVVERIRAWRVEILERAMGSRPLTVVR